MKWLIAKVREHRLAIAAALAFVVDLLNGAHLLGAVASAVLVPVF